MIHKTAIISAKAKIGKGVAVWAYTQIREGVEIGENSIIGSYVYLDHDVIIGKNVKIQNRAQLYYGSIIEDEVFIGPGVLLLNDKYPRATNKQGSLKKLGEWKVGKIEIGKGASVGGGSVILPGVTIGKYALVGAGSVVTAQIPAHCLAYGNPARIAGRVCPQGHIVKDVSVCPKCGERLDLHDR